MEITFKNNKLQKICNSKKEAIRELGSICGEKLMQRLLELNAAESLKDISHLPPARCHLLVGNRYGQFSVDLKHPYRLIFIPKNLDMKSLNQKDIDYKNIKEIEIIEITDTH